jgi:uncharacterized membrane protein
MRRRRPTRGARASTRPASLRRAHETVADGSTGDPRSPRVLYLEGDRCAVKFLAGALQNAGLRFERPQRATAAAVARADTILLSDWPAKRLPAAVQEAVAERVAGGATLMMVGGWTSFGRGGYAASRLADLLPVRLLDGDDRRACLHGAYPVATAAGLAHPVLAELALGNPPVLCGYNRAEAREGATTLLEVREVELWDGEPTLSPRRAPLLVAGTHGAGAVLAYLGDLAPHWSGGLTDWGNPLPAPEHEEVGHLYVRFVESLLRWRPEARERPAGPRTRQQAGALPRQAFPLT